MVLRTIDNFLTDEQCDYLIQFIDANNQRSSTSKDGVRTAEDPLRTSYTSNLQEDDEVVKTIKEKISKELNIPIEHGEGLQGQKYEVGQFFRKHFDFFEGKSYESECLASGNRTNTLMVYLNDDFEGGGTDFPNIPFTTTPKKGTAVTWTNTVNGQGILESMHEGMDVTKGTKYIITSWWRENKWDGAKDKELALQAKEQKQDTFELKIDQPRLTVVRDQNKFTSHEDFPKFTDKGFTVVDVPDDAWELMQEMWEEVRLKGSASEDFPGKENVITGNEKTSNIYDLGQVWEKRNRLHTMLLPLHEEWCGEKLEPSFIYGVREYLQAADLKQHKDKIETHHISSIVLLDKNLKCGCTTRELGDDWPLDIQAHDGTWHKVYLEPKQMILYESCACSHGRDERFQGKYFRNFFIHYKLKNWIYER